MVLSLGKGFLHAKGNVHTPSTKVPWLHASGSEVMVLLSPSQLQHHWLGP